jgi:hypothetical protein
MRVYGVEWHTTEKYSITDRTHYVSEMLFSAPAEATTYGNICSTQMEYDGQEFKVIEFDLEGEKGV